MESAAEPRGVVKTERDVSILEHEVKVENPFSLASEVPDGNRSGTLDIEIKVENEEWEDFEESVANTSKDSAYSRAELDGMLKVAKPSTSTRKKRGRRSKRGRKSTVSTENLPPGVEETFCFFCNRHKSHSAFAGDAAFHEAEGIKAHHLCLLFSAALTQDGGKGSLAGFTKQQIMKELRRIARLKCAHCGKIGAGMGCAVPKCRKSFHYPCGLEADALLQYHGEYRCYCKVHRPEVTFSKKYLSEETCVSCLDGFAITKVPGKKGTFQSLKPFSLVKMRCCKKALMHRDCLLSLALNFGYQFKCPFCNNDVKKARKRFQLVMRHKGIFVPKRDSVWEREPDAFGEQLCRPTTCSAPDCLFIGCDIPRLEHCVPELELCGTCGARAVHLMCIGREEPNWTCGPCSGEMTPAQQRSKLARFPSTALSNRRLEPGTPRGRERTGVLREPLLHKPVGDGPESPTRRPVVRPRERKSKTVFLRLSEPKREGRSPSPQHMSTTEVKQEATEESNLDEPLLFRLIKEKYADRTTGLIPKLEDYSDIWPERKGRLFPVTKEKRDARVPAGHGKRMKTSK